MHTSKKIFLGLVILLLTLWGFYLISPTFQTKVSELIKSAQQIAIKGTITEIGEEIFSTPLKGRDDASEADLTIAGVITYSNIQRGIAGLPELVENDLLNDAATLKLEDMFTKQYFEHVSPEGNGPGYLAEQVGYSYIVIGENLALGNFKDDEALVQAWMDSPGHRANILHTRFREIGVAVGQGTFEGKKVWLAVQEFGSPLADCPAISTVLKNQIDKDKATSVRMSATIEAIEAEIERMPRKTAEEQKAYNLKVDEYNSLITQYDKMLGTLRANIDKYNTQVQAYNACIKQ